MGFKTAEEAYEQFLQTGQYMNHEGHFEGTPEEKKALFGAYKHMIPQQVKKDFRGGVQQNEVNAIEGMSQGLSREQMDIHNIKEQGQALWRRLGAGLGTGLDINKAYDWGAGSAREVGTTDMAKWGTTRGITADERARNAAFQGAGSPEAFWQQQRANQINQLVSNGSIRPDGRGGYFNPGPGGGDRYGANLEGYNLGAGPMGPGAPRPQMGGGFARSPIPATPFANRQAPTPATPAATPQPTPQAGTGTVHFQAPKPPSSITGMGMTDRNSGFTGGMSAKNPFGVISAAGGYTNPVMPPGPLPDGGTPMVVHPGENVSVTPASRNPNVQNQGSFGGAVPRPGGMTNEIGPGQAGIPNNLPNGRSPFGSNPMPMPTGTGIVWGPNGPTNAGGGNLSPNLPGINLPGHIPMSPWGAGTPWGQGLQGAGQMDNSGQQFQLERAMQEYAKSFGPEQALMKFYGQALGVDAMGNPLQGEALNLANRQSFGQLAPQAGRIAGDTDASLERLRGMPQGGARDRMQAEILSGAQSGMLGLRQDMQGQALQGMGQIMEMQKGFNPAAYQGGNQALLGAEVNTRGQDLSTLLGQRGQDIDAQLQGRGQDAQWGLGWGGLANSASQNLWDSYFTGRGQDLGQYSTMRGQDLNYQAQQQAIRAQKDAQDKSWWQNLTGTLGGIVGMANPLGGLLGGGRSGGASGSW